MTRKSTPAQQAASRANGKLSAGRPRRGSSNQQQQANTPLTRRLLTRRITANAVCLASENRQAFQALFRSFIRDLAPATDTEFLRVETLVSLEWRLRRLWETERATMDQQFLAEIQASPQSQQQPPVDPTTHLARAERKLADSTRTIERLHAQEARLIRAFNATLAQFHALRKLRPSSEVPEKIAPPLTRAALIPNDLPLEKPDEQPGDNPDQPGHYPANPAETHSLKQ